jgi:hypothetical protein
MKMTKHQKRLEKLSKVAKELDAVHAQLVDVQLSLKQRVGMTLAVHEVQEALNRVRVWSQVS